MTGSKIFDAIIVGGSYAGLSGAMALGRSLRSVLILDSGQPCNRQTPHSHNFLTQDGSTPKEIAELGKKQVLQYDTVAFYSGLAINGHKQGDLFTIVLDTGKQYQAKKLLFTTGVKDILPNIPGFSDCWGISVLHCPYCHGYEVRRRKIGLLGNGDLGFELSRLINNWSSDLTLYTNGKSALTMEQSRKLTANGIRIVEKEIDHFDHQKGYIEHIAFKDGTAEPMEAMFARGSFEQHCSIPMELDCELTEQGYLKIDEFLRTTVPGVYAAGDNTTIFRSVAAAVAAGNKAGALINKELIDEAF